MDKKIIVVGGGASGFMAAIQAARNGASVTILEQNGKFGKKLLSTGNGKCNLTNTESYADCYRSNTPDFASTVMFGFDVQQTIQFFLDIGIYTKNKNGYLYPHSEQAASVIEVLEMEARNLKIKLKTQETVTEIIPTGSFVKYVSKDGNSQRISFRHSAMPAPENSISPEKAPARNFLVKTKTWEYPCDAVILACGSKASVIEGSDGSGYKLVADLGHKIIKPLPALTGVKGKNNYYGKWAGVRTSAAVTLAINGHTIKQETGEVQLTDYGVSGIPVFQLSRYAARALDEGSNVSMFLDFLPEFDPSGLVTFLKSRRERNPYKNMRESLIGLFPEKLIDVLLTGTDTIEELAKKIKYLEVPVKETLSFEHAQVCSGGINCQEIEPMTMESKLVPGIYFCGELVDVDGACGGYNLQWAWSSGAVAGISASKV